MQIIAQEVSTESGEFQFIKSSIGTLQEGLNYLPICDYVDFAGLVGGHSAKGGESWPLLVDLPQILRNLVSDGQIGQ